MPLLFVIEHQLRRFPLSLLNPTRELAKAMLAKRNAVYERAKRISVLITGRHAIDRLEHRGPP
jgi:hypothetical protein